MKVLQKGVRDSSVIFLRQLLYDFGCVGPDSQFWAYVKKDSMTDADARDIWATSDVFDNLVEEAVIYFQQTHEDPFTGLPLKVDGIVGPHTWAALEKGAKGLDELKGLKADGFRPRGMGDKIIAVWNKYVGIKETPKGSNRGPIIDKFTRYEGKPNGVKGPAWCDASASYVENEALGYYPLKYLWRCYDTMMLAKKLGFWIPVEDVRKGEKRLRVGARFIMQYGGKRGHTGHVAYIEYAKDGRPTHFYTREGNYNDSVGIAYRSIEQSSLAGFCDFLPADDRSVGQKGRKITIATDKDKTT